VVPTRQHLVGTTVCISSNVYALLQPRAEGIDGEDEEAAQRFKGFALGDARQEAQEEGGAIIDRASSWRCLPKLVPDHLLSSIHRSAWKGYSPKFTSGLA
jgi:hypothetical protein